MTGAQAQLDSAGAAIAEGVARCLPGWVERQVDAILEAWGRLEPSERAAVAAQATQAGSDAASRVGAALEELFATDPAEQRTTPLEIVRRAYEEPTAILVAAGIPPVERDGFDQRAWPDDRYGLVIRTLADLGDASLGPLHLAWGLAKAKLLRARPGRPA